MFKINKIAIETALNSFNNENHPLISPLGPALNQPDPAPSLKAWLRNDYNQAKPQDKEQLAPLARCIALELIQPNHYQRVTTAFKELYPRVSNIYGQTNLSDDEFLNGAYYVYMDGPNPTIVKMPCAINSMIPKIKKLEDVPAAMAALESTSMQEDKDETGLKNLNTHAKKMSARAVVEAYNKDQPKTQDDFIRFIKDLPHRFSRVGFTGEPYSEVNAMLAQIAWACEPGSHEMFWKILYPEITGVIDGDSNTQWPRYGDAILSESLAEKKPGSILNYRQLWKKAETTPLELIEETRVSGFCPAHRDYWLEVVTRRKNGSANHPERKLVFKTEFSNYYEFFDSMRAFMDAYKATDENGWGSDFGKSPEGLQVMLDFRAYQEVILNAPKNLKAIFNSIDQLSIVLKNVVGEKTGEKFTVRIRESCFATNSHTLKNILSRDEVKEILSSIPFEPKSIAPLETEYALIEGHDALLYLPEHTSFLGSLSENSLIDLINSHQRLGIDLQVLVERFRPIIDSSPYKSEKLFNTVYQINDLSLRKQFIEKWAGNPLDFKSLIRRFEKSREPAGIQQIHEMAARIDMEFILKILDIIDIDESEKIKIVEELSLAIPRSLSNEIKRLKEFDVPQLINFLDEYKTELEDFKVLLDNNFEGFDAFHYEVNLIKNNISQICFFPSGSVIDSVIRRQVIDLITQPTVVDSLDQSKVDQINRLIEKWLMPRDTMRSEWRAEFLLEVLQKYSKTPQINQKIEDALSSADLFHYLDNTFFNPRTWLAFDILNRRNELNDISKIIKMVIILQKAPLTEPEIKYFHSWVKLKKNSIFNAEQFSKIIHQTQRYNAGIQNLENSIVFELLYQEFGFFKTYDDYLIVAAPLNPAQRALLKEKYPDLKRPSTGPCAINLDQTDDCFLFEFLYLAFNELTSKEEVEGYIAYYYHQFALLLHKDPAIRFPVLFDQIAKLHGLQETTALFLPIFIAHLESNPSTRSTFFIHSEHQEQVFLSISQHKRDSQPVEQTSQPLLLSQRKTQEVGANDLHEIEESPKRLSPE